MRIGYFFAVLRASFYSKDFYRAVGREWKGYAFGYLLGTIALIGIVVVTFCLTKISAIDVSHIPSSEKVSADDDKEEMLTVNDLLAGIITQIPVVTIDKGELSIKEQVPYTIFIPGTMIPFAIIDTTGKTTTLKGSEAVILVMKKELVVGEDGQRYDIEKMAANKRIIIDHDMIIRWIGNLKLFLMWFIPLVVFPLMVGVVMAYSLMRCLFYAVIGTLFSHIKGIKLPFDRILRLTIVAAIPLTIISALPIVVPQILLIPYQQLIFFMIGIFYVFFAVYSNREAGSE